jgi:hypothetical protein
MNFRSIKVASPSPQPALDLLAFAFMSPDVARQNLRSLLVSNPNYFGNLSDSSFKAVLQIQDDTTYESLSQVHYLPSLHKLHATLAIQQATGYSDDRSSCSQEYVRFYISDDDGASWSDQGVRGVNVCDSPGPKPLESVISLGVREDAQGLLDGRAFRVRAILSWNQPPPPASPHWRPVWGNVFESNMQVKADSERTDAGNCVSTAHVCREESVMVSGSATAARVGAQEPTEFASSKSQVSEGKEDVKRSLLRNFWDRGILFSIPMAPFHQNSSGNCVLTNS